MVGGVIQKVVTALSVLAQQLAVGKGLHVGVALNYVTLVVAIGLDETL